jgi:uncharacterized membrane protein YdjX (TVP38/TMEM64 family)
LAAVLLAGVGIAALEPLHNLVSDAIDAVDPLVRAHPVSGALLFLLLAALSALLAFFSSAVLVPIAVEVWGPVGTAILLWLGWLAGGAVTYAIGRFLGRGIVNRLVRPGRLQYYERRVRGSLRFPFVLLFQSALPSEVPGYLLGILRYPPHLYLLALGLAELPYAIGSVALGEQFVEGRIVPMAVLAVVAVTGIGWAAARLHRELERGSRGTGDSPGDDLE